MCKGAFGVSHRREQCITIQEWGRRIHIWKKTWKSSATVGVNLSPPSSLLFSRKEEGCWWGNVALLSLAVNPCGCFPSSTVSPELPRLVSCRADRVSRQASWLPVVISGGRRGCNLCQATWRFGLDWSVSAPHSHTMSIVRHNGTPAHDNIWADVNLKD